MMLQQRVVQGVSSRRQQLAPAMRRPQVAVRVMEAEPASTASSQPDQALTRVTLKKPMGIVFEQKKGSTEVVVAEVAPGSHADRCGRVAPGDVLVGCSAVVLKRGKEGQYEREGYGDRPYDNWEVIQFECEGQDFKTCMDALRSNNTRLGKTDIDLVLRRTAAAA